MEAKREQTILNHAQAIVLEASKIALRERAKPELACTEEKLLEQLNLRSGSKEDPVTPDAFLTAKKPADNSTVTSADILAQDYMQKELHKIVPEAAFTGEEKGGDAGAEASLRWVADPVDGTGNFLRGKYPEQNPNPERRRFGHLLALEEAGNPVIAVMFCPEPDASAKHLNGTLYVATAHTLTRIIPVREGEMKTQEAVEAQPLPRPAAPQTFSYGTFDPALLGPKHGQPDTARQALTTAAAEHGMQGREMFCFAAGAEDVLTGRGVCANGVNCEWDSAAPALLFQQAGIPFAEYANGTGPDGSARFAMIAAPDTTSFAAVNDAYNAQFAGRTDAPPLLRFAHTTPPCAAPASAAAGRSR